MRPAVVRGGYSRAQRAIETLGIGLYMCLAACSAWQVAGTFDDPWNVLVASTTLVSGAIGADFLTGLVHWAADTWGRPSWPVLGNAFIRPFREHHVDPKAITRHDFVETSGANCLACLPAQGAAVALFEPTTPGLVLASSITSLCAWVFATNQFHKWAHAEAPPRCVALLQRLHLILPPGHHQVHHTYPFAQHYCIPTGWLNPPLAFLGFFRRLELWVTAFTEASPREDDLVRIRTDRG